MKYDEIIEEVAKKNNLSKAFTDKIYKYYWKAIRVHISSLPLKKDLSDEEFLQLQPNINIPSIGKLYITLDRYKRIKNYYKKCLEAKNKNNDTYQED